MDKRRSSFRAGRGVTAAWAAFFTALLAGGTAGAENVIRDGEQAFSAAGTIIAAAVLCVLAVLIRKNGAAAKEAALFRELRRKKDTAALLLEALAQALTLVVFYRLFRFLLFLGGISSPRLLILPAAAGSALLWSQYSFSSAARKAVKAVGYATLVAYCYYVLAVHGYTRFTEPADLAAIKATDAATPWIQALCAVLFLSEMRINMRGGLLAAAVRGMLLLTNQAWPRPLLLEFTCFVMLADLLGSPRTTARVLLGAMLVYIAFLLLGLKAGWTESRVMQFSYSPPVRTWGTSHTNLTALVLMTVLLLIWYLRLRDRPVLTLVIFVAAAAGIWFLTCCRTVALLLFLFPAFGFALGRLVRRKGDGCRILLAYMPLLFAAVSVILMLTAGSQSLKIDQNFLMRFRTPYRVAAKEGLKLYQVDFPRLYVIDNLFLHILVYYGIIPGLVLPALMSFRGWQYYRNGQYAELSLLAFMMCYSLMENAVIHLPFGFALLLTLPAGEGRKWPAPLEKRFQNIGEARREAGRKAAEKLRRNPAEPKKGVEA